MTPNVLLTSTGRRGYLVRYFKDAVGEAGRVFAGDARADAPALQLADEALLLPPASEPGYVDRLLEICARHRIGLLLSLNDLELPVLARRREEFRDAGTIACVSAPTVVERCFDKWAGCRFLRERELPTPRSYLSVEDALAALAAGELRYPLFLKPRWGSASLGVEEALDEEDLRLAYRSVRKRLAASPLGSAGEGQPAVLIQEKLAGAEYGLDIINDLEGRHVATFVKRKLALRAGETDKAVTVAEPELEALGARLGEALGHVGLLDCDVFVTEAGYHVIDLNPRFGGGYPFSHAAGANVPAALVAWAQGKPARAEWLRVTPGVTGAKQDYLQVIAREPRRDAVAVPTAPRST